jgi:hypothetical protein
LSGYDPRGAQGYFELFQRTCHRFQRLWPVALTLQPPQEPPGDFASWELTLRGVDWQVETRYDFLRTEHFIRDDMARSTAPQVLRALGWCLDDTLTGTQLRIVRAAWRFALHLWYFQLLALIWLAAAAAAAFAAFSAGASFLNAPPLLSAVAALVAFVLVLLALRPLADRLRLVQIASCWATLRRFGRGRPTWLDEVIETGVQRVLAVGASDADELVVIGHSTGGVIASAITARALELDPDLGNKGPRLALLTLGSVMPAVVLHPRARRMRAIVQRLAVAPRLAWIDCQSRKDVMCFFGFDPVDGVGLRAGANRCNPMHWRIGFKEMIAPEDYDRFRWNHFRVHYQYIMAGERPAPYDYILLVGGPMPIAAWPRRDREFTAALLRTGPPGTQRHRNDGVIGAVP